MGCGHKIVLRKNMSYGKTSFSGLHVFQGDIYYDSICLEGGHALLLVISYGISSIGGMHIFRLAYLTFVVFY